MDKINQIIENIKKKKFSDALSQCDEFQNEKNKHQILNLRGVINLINGKIDLAEENFYYSSIAYELFQDPLKNLYLIYIKKKDFTKAINIGHKLYELDKYNDSYSYQLASAYELNNNLPDAINFYKVCIELNGKYKIKALNNVGGIYLRNNKPKTAINFFLAANQIAKNDKVIINNILLNYIKLKNEKKSDEYFSLLEEIDNKSEGYLYNKANYFILKEKYEDAIEILEKNKKNIKFLVILIDLYFNMGNNQKAKLLLDSNRNEIKKDASFLSYIGIRSLKEGNFEDGWKYYENRGSKITNHYNEIKEWKGENLIDKNIVVYSEQGIGDSLQFSKYVYSLTEISNNVFFIVKDSIKDLFRKDIKNLKIINKQEYINENLNYKISLGSLLKFFYKKKYTSHDYLLYKNKLKINNWKKKLDNSKPNVGIVWSGSFYGPNQPLKSVPLEKLKKIFNLDINYYYLQNEIWERDKFHLNNLNIFNCGKYDLVEISSIIENLDLVIAVDTSILHLSAMQDKETWGLLSIYPDWRWEEFDKINPYKSLIKFNQNQFNYWDNIINEVYEKLKNKFKLN